MALYPLPPSSNENVIDNGSNVWQMAMHIILVLSHNLLKHCCLSHAGMLPWRFSVHCEMNKETISNSRTKKPIDICDESIAAACMHLPPFLLGLVWDRAMTCDTLLEICSYLQAPQRDRSTVALSFFFFFYCRSHNESGPNPLPPIWKFFRLSAMCGLLRWPVTNNLFLEVCFSRRFRIFVELMGFHKNSFFLWQSEATWIQEKAKVDIELISVSYKSAWETG